MIRDAITPRTDWQTKVEALGFRFHTVDGRPYWNESACYRFGADEIDAIESATYGLDKLCLQAVEHVLDHPELLGAFAISPSWLDFLRASWDADEITIYGRFDLAYEEGQPPKLLEYNADTPTGLLEAAVVQWYWLKDVFPGEDQFNSIHERLIEAWKRYKTVMTGKMMYFSSMDEMEDFMTVTYLQDTAVQAGCDARYIQTEDIGWHARRQVFTDLDENEIRHIFKLYPWEWLLRDSFADRLSASSTKWLEPPWKMILSNKAILAVLWKLFPDHPNLLPASFAPMDGPSVRKPVLAREGANILLKADDNSVIQTGGPYGPPYVYQRYHKLPDFAGSHPVIGSWMVNGYACGIGIREDDSLITGNLSRFVPHHFS